MNGDIIGGLLHDGTYRARWLREVLKTPQITDSVRVLLMTLALHMDASGRVSVPREDLAGLLGRNPRKVADKVKVALDSGFLMQTARGQKHQTAVYQAAISGQSLSVPLGGQAEESWPSDLSVPPGGHAEDSQGAGFKQTDSQGAGFSVPPGGHAEDSQGAPRGPSHSYMRVDVEEEDPSSSDSLFDLDSPASREPETEKPAKRKTKIPASFAVTPAMRSWAAETAPVVDIDFETAQFVDHWTAKGELRLDWVASWRTWMRNQQRWASDRRGNVRQLRPTGTDGRPFNGSGPRIDTQTPYSENLDDY
ncbi:hypothetical protein IMZ11_02625 [Microtetraspora sp. AC03309]|uniref:hypothetical protein n=1 Tax=Microtetraspora sp. AC03309 TaxID=2779376 RepID=UPI001E50CC6D|nr:hypothetical protein [Microtetraspora sp. AC03309]MCC5574534.1 hypothetical protein [Microtetraspora sp. AC03309]